MRAAIVMSALTVSFAGCQREPGEAIAATEGSTPTEAQVAQITPSRLAPGDLAREIRRVRGEAIVGFKEADQARGVDARGVVITASTTTTRMVQYLEQHGAKILHRYSLVPAVLGPV